MKKLKNETSRNRPCQLNHSNNKKKEVHLLKPDWIWIDCATIWQNLVSEECSMKLQSCTIQRSTLSVQQQFSKSKNNTRGVTFNLASNEEWPQNWHCLVAFFFWGALSAYDEQQIWKIYNMNSILRA